MNSMTKRRDFLKITGAGLAIGGVLGPKAILASQRSKSKFISISLAEWSLHKELFGGQLGNLDFAKTAKEEFDIDAVEYVNQFFKDEDMNYIKEMKQRAEDNGVQSVLIMCDGEGRIGDPDAKARLKAVENHYKWVDAAVILGCHSIRVNAASEGDYDMQRQLAADGLAKLTEYGAKNKINIIVENHGGLSSNGKWLSSVIETVNNPMCGTLPDFGNFRISDTENYDRYEGVKELMPFAKGVSAKSHDFDEKGNETTIDFFKMMKIVMDAGYTGHVGIEYEGSRLSERDGIRATKKLLERVARKLAP
jgi:L-ribulose-5-phosphate 3-epimerase